jgi:hypothetical protein
MIIIIKNNNDDFSSVLCVNVVNHEYIKALLILLSFYHAALPRMVSSTLQDFLQYAVSTTSLTRSISYPFSMSILSASRLDLYTRNPAIAPISRDAIPNNPTVSPTLSSDLEGAPASKVWRCLVENREGGEVGSPVGQAGCAVGLVDGTDVGRRVGRNVGALVGWVVGLVGV